MYSNKNTTVVYVLIGGVFFTEGQKVKNKNNSYSTLVSLLIRKKLNFNFV